MLRFFKNIRLKMAAENKAIMYLRYAIGEIVLVVIGILIALQVNNWNERRIQHKKELGYLKEIKENLQYDIRLIDTLLDFNSKKDSVLQVSMDVLLNNPSSNEIANTLAKNLSSNSEFDLFDQKRVAFENMTSSENIDLIGNDSLRIHLTSYYQEEFFIKEGSQTRLINLIRTFVDQVTPLILNKQTIKTLLKKDNNWPTEIELSQKDKALLLSSLRNIQDNVKAQNEMVVEYRKIAKNLVVEIEQVLKEN